ncbi:MULTISPECIES: hypothetical protein [Pseudomonas]|jgi:hypothetical protein|uniref:Uncharacterized protein n=1 Tax=Pseudomonas gingeri TaxID=117681 RepID=A0A7Y7WH69_9PSED|nr:MULTISPECIES: hypothetical protein [Pseudomonas]MCU1737189.1 hypothetical protein [Pseudomonas sp. 20S_6.2_Bac1]NWB49430.1 hypothetical protein [Pseudomonas gingeri]
MAKRLIKRVPRIDLLLITNTVVGRTAIPDGKRLKKDNFHLKVRRNAPEIQLTGPGKVLRVSIVQELGQAFGFQL